MSHEHTEATIINYLHSKYAGNSVYRVPNAYIFKHNWESDFFVLKQNGYGYEFEIKISRRDFLKDKEKVEKHLILETGKYMRTRYNLDTSATHSTYQEEAAHNFRPNKFFYVVPAGLIKAHEVPPYAGLMNVSDFGSITTIKEAPFIHKEKLKFEEKLCLKFYHYWMNSKLQAELNAREIKQLQSKLEQLTDKTETDAH